MTDEMKELMGLSKGATLICITDKNGSQGVEENMVYTFLEYDESNVPKNDLSATMTWYTSKPVWTPEEYEEIRFKFMLVKLHGVEKSVSLKDFRVFLFTE